MDCRRRVDEDESTHMNADRIAGPAGPLSAIIEAWAALQAQVPLKPVRSETDFQRMTRLASELTDHLQGDAQHPLADLLGVVTDLVGVWGTRHVEVLPEAAPRDVLRHLLETHKLRQKDLSDIASPTVISDILAGRRAISKNVAKALAVRFHTDVARFL
ncbi:HTH-type transcriptional regulator / antitoxin HigA [Paraburkholderia megapolitana]|uniref:HTH-type transcriptional regulator / antitoxin HigA n=2 Tax=Paraburkholderia megapolitana TaxID=420953 RepID=A0A1I3RDI0_9BURK|nr:HTH-type transcriptional regulator / antitoxin HigA [Paraburkholderia megapolitana]